jgi:microcystin-dependent protein
LRRPHVRRKELEAHPRYNAHSNFRKEIIMQLRRLALVVAALTLAPAAARAQEPLLGEIRWVAFDFAPKGWAKCDGQLLPISQNTALFSLLGTTYGGNGQTTFALPDFRGRTMLHQGQGPGLSERVIGEEGGTESHTLTIAEMPAHSHGGGEHTHSIPSLGVNVGASSGAATQATAAGNVLATATLAAGGNGNGNGNNAPRLTTIYNAGPANVTLGAGSTTDAGTTGTASGGSVAEGNGQPHPTISPFLAATCLIAVEGIFPSRQ